MVTRDYGWKRKVVLGFLFLSFIFMPILSSISMAAEDAAAGTAAVGVSGGGIVHPRAAVTRSVPTASSDALTTGTPAKSSKVATEGDVAGIAAAVSAVAEAVSESAAGSIHPPSAQQD